MIVLQERGKVGLLKSAANASFELLLTPEGSPSPHDASRDQRTGAFCPCGHRGDLRGQGRIQKSGTEEGRAVSRIKRGACRSARKNRRSDATEKQQNDPSGGCLRYLLV